MPAERPTPPPFESDDLDRSLDRYLAFGVVFMLLLIVGFVAYRAREPRLRREATVAQQASYRQIGAQLFASNCTGCHGKNATGGSGPVLNSKQFLSSSTDDQIRGLISGGVPGTEMPAWSLSFSGTLTDEQILQITTYLRSLEAHAPSVPNWRAGKA